MLKSKLSYDSATGVFTRRAEAKYSRKASAGAPVGVRAQRGYLMLRIGKRKYMAHRLAWLYVHGRWPCGDIDHVNRVVDDNRIANLREATRSQNMANTVTPRANSSGVKGVCFDKATNRWLAYTQVNGKFKNLGRFDQIDEAITARRLAFKEAFGEFARHA